MRAMRGRKEPKEFKYSDTYGENLEGMKKIAFFSDVMDVCNWFLGFCALTWAAAVLLGAQVQNLSIWDFYDISVLLFLEGLRFGLAALLRLLGYRLSDFHRLFLRYVALFIPLVMGGFAIFSILPGQAVYNFYPGQQPSLRFCPPSQSTTSYAALCPSIYTFYGLILANTLVFLLGSAITGLLRLLYVRPITKGLTKYYDNMIHPTKTWLQPAVGLDFAFKVQSSRYRKVHDVYSRHGKLAAYYVCENYADLIWYLYTHEKGVEAAETALAAEDGYVREAAAYIVGFWAVLDSLEEAKNDRLPLCFHRKMLSKLAAIAAEDYGPLGIAAARSFGLMLESMEFEMISMVASVESESCGKKKSVGSEKCHKDLIDILIERAVELIAPPCFVSIPILQKCSQAHVYALWKYIKRLQDPAVCENECEITVTSKEAAALHTEEQRDQLLEKMKAALPDHTINSIGMSSISTEEKWVMLEHLEKTLFNLLPPAASADCCNNYYNKIRSYLVTLKPHSYKVLTFHVAFMLTCLGVGGLLCLAVGKFFL